MRRALLLMPAVLAGCMPVPPPGGSPPAPMSARSRPHRELPPPAVLPLDRIVAAGGYPTLALAIAAARLDPVLAGAGPVTLFAPDEAAWTRLAPGVREALLRPENRGSLAALLRFHCLAGRIDVAALRRLAAAGPASLPTLAGEPLTISLASGAILLTDATGHRAFVVGGDGPATNGLILEVNGLLVPQALGRQP